MTPFLSVVPLTPIVVEPSTPPALIVNPPTEATSTDPVASSSAATPVILLIHADESEVPPETSMSTDRLYFEDDPWFTVIV